MLATFSDHARLGEHRLPHLQFALRRTIEQAGGVVRSQCGTYVWMARRIETPARSRRSSAVPDGSRCVSCAASRRFPDRGMCGRCEGSTSEPGSAAALRSGGWAALSAVVVPWSAGLTVQETISRLALNRRVAAVSLLGSTGAPE